jgi:E3 ubiquitin-protein ligase HUWE1
LHVSTKRLIALANRWPGIREHGLDFVDLFTMSKTVQIPPEAAQVTHTFYKKGTSVSPTEKVDVTPSQTPVKPKAVGSAIPVTPSAGFGSVPSPTVSGMVTINIPSLIDSEKRAVDILADEIEANSIPDEEKFELLCRIRCALALGNGPVKLKERENLAIIRLLAIAIFAHTISENEAQTALFIYEPDLILHLAEFIHPDRAVSMGIQTAAIAALDGLARYRGKTGEVLSAVNAGVTHGILMSLLRRTVISLAEPNCECSSLIMDKSKC